MIDATIVRRHNICTIHDILVMPRIIPADWSIPNNASAVGTMKQVRTVI